jgi:hypothetical protein
MVDVTEGVGLLVFIENICTSGGGTITSAWKDRNGCNCYAYFVGILQAILAPLCGIGWFWSIYHGWIVYQNSKGKLNEYRMIKSLVKDRKLSLYKDGSFS